MPLCKHLRMPLFTYFQNATVYVLSECHCLRDERFSAHESRAGRPRVGGHARRLPRRRRHDRAQGVRRPRPGRPRQPPQHGRPRQPPQHGRRRRVRTLDRDR